MPIGKFCSEGGYVGYCIDFKYEGNVEYSYWGCMSSYSKSGRYEIIDDSLILNFDTISQPLKKPLVENKSSQNKYSIITDTSCSDGSTEIYVTVSAVEEKELMPFAEVSISNSDSTLMTSFTDFDGKTRFKIEKQFTECFISTSYVGYKDAHIKIQGDSCITVLIELASNPFPVYSLDSGKISRLSYKIESMDVNDVVLVMNQNSILFSKK